MAFAALVLFVANVFFGTSPVVTRVVLDDVPPVTIALLRLALAGLALVPFVRREGRPAPGQGARVFWMGAIGFSVAFAFSHWGIERSSATNAALLIVVEPLTIVALGPLMLGERLTRREAAGAALAIAGALLVVVNGVPGVTLDILPRWRGDLLLVLSGVAYGIYSLLGRTVLTGANTAGVTARSILWGALLLVPLAGLEWATHPRPQATPSAVAGILYLGLMITAAGYTVWNWALTKVEASRAAPFLTVQPVVGALLGALVLGEAVTRFTVTGGALIVLGLWLTVTGRR
ncbi:MAG TPA: DMT family transporter [Methylomirabilota bacterium]|nr:DMT family transporter [Methylomirabilota bacterium]